MQIATKVWLASLLGCSVLYCHEARATTELPGLYDARSVALGGTGSSYIENGASVFLNPAALDGITTFAATVAITPVQPTLTVPLPGATGGLTEVKADTPFFPLFLLGAGFRLSDRIVAGLAVYPTAGFGSTYTKAIGGEDLSFSVAQFEAAPTVSVKIIDGLSLGLSYRITYVRQSAHQPGMPPAEISLDGTNFFGVQAGVYYRPLEMVHLAFTYRSRVDTKMTGTTDLGGMKFDTTSGFNSPNRFRLGASISPPGIPLLIAADVKYLLFADSNQSSDVTVTTPMGSQTTTQRLDWKNSLAFGLGVEYAIVPLVAARVGYSLSQSATPESNPTPFTPPPGAFSGIHFGVGLKLPMIDVDVGGMYAFASKTIAANPNAPTVIPGEYKLSSLQFALSATYHM